MTRKGQKHDKCNAILPNGINFCQRPPGWGTDHLGFGRCRHHGGATPNGIKSAAVREARQRGLEFGQNHQTIDPADAMRQELARTHQLLEWARQKCQAIIEQTEENQKKAPKQRDENIPAPVDIILDSRFIGYKNILDDERDRLVRIARSSMDASIQNRKQQLAEALAAVVIDCFHAMTRAIPDLTPAQLDAAKDQLKLELQSATERLLLPAGNPS